MAFTIQYFLTFLCIKLTYGMVWYGMVQQNQFLSDIFDAGVNPDCKSFPIPNENSTLLALDCVFPVPDLTNQKVVNHDLKFKVTHLMCYSALSNMMRLCPSEGEELAAGKDLGVDINSIKVETFCEEAASLLVEHDCSKMNPHDKGDCELLKKVVPVTVSNIIKCKEICIVYKEYKELFSVCQYLYASTKALLQALGEGVVLKPTPRIVVTPAEIPKTPVGSSSKPSIIVKDIKAGHELFTVFMNFTQPKDNKNIPTAPETEESTHKPDNVKGPIVENTRQDAKSISVDDLSSCCTSYFILWSIMAIVAYLVFHNKQKILAVILEGRLRQGYRRKSGDDPVEESEQHPASMDRSQTSKIPSDSVSHFGKKNIFIIDPQQLMSSPETGRLFPSKIY